MEGSLGIEALSTEDQPVEGSGGISGGGVVVIALGVGVVIVGIGVAAMTMCGQASSNAGADVEKQSEVESTTSPSKAGGTIRVDEVEIVESK